VVGAAGETLGAIEGVGTVIVLLLLAGGLIARRRRLTPVVVVAVVFGIVFANPFGVVARRSVADPGPLTASADADGSRQWVKVAGLPVAWFTPYNEEYFYADLYENTPNSALRLRYGLSFLPSTGASKVVDQCSNSISDPCWRGRSNDYPLIQHDHSGKTWIVPISQTVRVDGRGQPEYIDVPQFYEVGLGLASGRAFAYWLLVACVMGVAAVQSRARWAHVGLAVAGCVAAGAVLAVVFAL
jgi:hypothetical protein